MAQRVDVAIRIGTLPDGDLVAARLAARTNAIRRSLHRRLP
jgi:hypothetical protein